MDATDMTTAYIIGAGIASLSTAVLLIRDGKFRGSNIRILEELEVAGSALDGSGDPLPSRQLWFVPENNRQVAGRDAA